MTARGWLASLAILFLAGCIEVEDFGAYWSQGVVDKKLAGMWVSVDDPGQCVRIAIEKGEYRFPPDADIGRTLAVGQHSFLMMKTPGEKKGDMMRYTLDGGNWALYALREEKKDEFLQKHASPNIAVGDTVTIHKLDKKTVALLQKIADDPSYWSVSSTYRRGECKDAGR